MNISRTNMIIFGVSGAVGIALFLILLFTADMGLWLIWLLAGAVASSLSVLLANVAIGYFAAGGEGDE